VWAAPELPNALTIGERKARPGDGGGGGHRSKKSLPSHPKYTKTAKRFEHVLAYKSPKTPFFAQKYLTRYTHKMFFEEYINFKIVCYLSHYGVIPV
jgi:hypothetical protein